MGNVESNDNKNNKIAEEKILNYQQQLQNKKLQEQIARQEYINKQQQEYINRQQQILQSQNQSNISNIPDQPNQNAYYNNQFYQQNNQSIPNQDILLSHRPISSSSNKELHNTQYQNFNNE